MTAFTRQLIHTCDIERFSSAQNDIGEPVKTWADIQVNEPCRLVVKEEKFADEQVGFMTRTVYRLLLKAGIDVTSSDRVKNLVLEDKTLTGPFPIEEVLTRRGPGKVNHLSLKLEYIR